MTDEEVAEWLSAARYYYSREAFPVRYSIFHLHSEGFMPSETNADRRGRQRDALKGALSGLSADAAKHLAEEVREAAHTDPQTHRRVVEIFERLGVEWPAGFKP